jgi:excisionase family DNA binding protein
MNQQTDTMKATIQLSPTVIHPTPQDSRRLFTDNELAAYLRICRRQLYTWRMSGLIPYIKIGKAVRFHLSDVELLLSSKTIQHKAKP